jgi:hypothetical protein
LNTLERSRKQAVKTVSDACLWGYIDGTLSAKERAEVERLISLDSHLYDRFERIMNCHDIILQYIPSGNIGEEKRLQLLDEVKFNVSDLLKEEKKSIFNKVKALFQKDR